MPTDFHTTKNSGSSVAETLGRAAFADRKGLDANPFSWLRDSNRREEWSNGWFAARDERVRLWKAQNRSAETHG